MTDVDLGVTLGALRLRNPIMTAAGTAGYGVEFANVLDLSCLGAHVVKSVAIFAHVGNPAPRLAPLPAGMLNSVGLPGPGVQRWLKDYYPRLADSGATFAVSIWGRTVDEYVEATRALVQGAPQVAFIELNVSCPNTEAGDRLFAHDPMAVSEIVFRCRQLTSHALYVKLSPNTDRVVAVAEAAIGAGADGLVAINTVFGQWFDKGKSVLGTARGGGLSGSQIHAIALRIVSDLRSYFPSIPIIGVGGISTVGGVVRMLLAGANAVQIGTASFVDPRRSQLLVQQLGVKVSSQGFSSLPSFLAHNGSVDRHGEAGELDDK
jgi:dihydroorotate dehydrogenase (NAD+) catalytic subunit